MPDTSNTMGGSESSYCAPVIEQGGSDFNNAIIERCPVLKERYALVYYVYGCFLCVCVGGGGGGGRERGGMFEIVSRKYTDILQKNASRK